MSHDGIKWNMHARIDKFSPDVVEELTRILGYEPKAADFQRFNADPASVLEVPGNLITTVGLGNLTSLLIGSGGNPLTGTTSGRAFVGVGTSTTAAAVGDTALIGTAYYNPFDANPTRVTTTVTNDSVEGVSTFGTSVANHAWEEWGWFTTTSGTLAGNTTLASVSAGTETIFNRKVASMGTKASGASWVFTTKVTFS